MVSLSGKDLFTNIHIQAISDSAHYLLKLMLIFVYEFHPNIQLSIVMGFAKNLENWGPKYVTSTLIRLKQAGQRLLSKGIFFDFFLSDKLK